MWLITPFGFFSIVQKPGTKHLTIRARVRDDLEQLKQRYLPSLGPIQDSKALGKHTDYRFRATASHDDVALAMAAGIRDIGYDNFKDKVAIQQGYGRAKVYSGVWSVLYELQQEKHQEAKAAASRSDEGASTKKATNPSAPKAPKASAPTAPKPPSSRLKPAYGTVVYDADTNRILLRAPTNDFGGMKWTLPKGRPDENESPEAAAIRETAEETGVTCKIIARIPGEYGGQTTLTSYWLAVPVSDSGTFGKSETREIRWADRDEAEKLIRQSPNKQGADRDIEVIDKAMQLVANGVLD